MNNWASHVHHSWRFGDAEALREVGPEMPERGSKTSTVPVVWATFGISSLGAIQMISCRNWWLWTKPGYITMTRRQNNNQWSGGIAAHPAQKIPSAKIHWESSRLDFLGSRRHPHYLPKGQISTRNITHLCWCNWRTFWRKNASCGRFSKGVLFLHDNAPAHRALATQEKMAYLGFQCPDHPPYSLVLTSSDYHLFLGLNKQLKGRHFSSVAEVIAAAETWLEGKLSDCFLSDLQKFEQRAKKYIELLGEYVE